jgi:hypothetical protein
VIAEGGSSDKQARSQQTDSEADEKCRKFLVLEMPILEFLWVHEANRDSGTVEDAHHLARHVVGDDWALCAAAA